MTKDEAATELCRRLVRDINEIAPAAIGRHDETWATVGPADAEFMVALCQWERTAAEVDRAAVRDAYELVLEAWREAARGYDGRSADPEGSESTLHGEA